jgi:HEAT repeat protein
VGKLSFKVGQDGKYPQHHWQLSLGKRLATRDRKHLEKSDMDINSYAPPVDKLLTYGDAHEHGGDPQDWPEYLELGIGPEHIPDLIRMATDEELRWAEPDTLEVWAPIHAWRTLGALHAEEAIEPLLSLLKDVDENDDDWVLEEMPEVYGRIGPAAIPALTAYMADKTHLTWARVTAIGGLEKIAKMHPESRDECVAVFTEQLKAYEDDDIEVNTFVMDSLVELKAVEAAPLIQDAFDADCVDPSMRGDWDDVQVELGLMSREEALEEERNQAVVKSVLSSIDAGSSPSALANPYARHTSRRSGGDRKKAKNKMAKQSRKKNKKRK